MLKRLLRRDRLPQTMPSAGPPAAGFAPLSRATPRIDRFSDEDLAELNRLLKWNCFTVDSQGRRVGDRARTAKREEPQDIPDRRIVLFDDTFALRDKHVLEVGCFEGVHTIALADRAREVTAIDSRIEHVVKTVLRCYLYGHAARFELEHRFGLPLREQPVHRRIVERDALEGEVGALGMPGNDEVLGQLEDRQRRQPEEVELDQADRFDVVLVELADRGVAAGLLVQRAEVGDAPGRDQHTARMHGR